MEAVIVFAIAAFFYFLPTVIAVARSHRNTFGVFITNLLLGWTAIGWVGSLVWSIWVSKEAA
jgi:hypothetical protein